MHLQRHQPQNTMQNQALSPLNASSGRKFVTQISTATLLCEIRLGLISKTTQNTYKGCTTVFNQRWSNLSYGDSTDHHASFAMVKPKPKRDCLII
jgi:hypothetical protein